MTFQQILAKFKNIASRALGFFPSPLPQGVAEFNQFVDSIIATYQPPMDPRSVKFVIATLIMRLNPTDAYKSKRYFALSLHKGAAGEVANYVMHLLKQEQAAELKAQQDKQQAEATADAGSSDDKSV
jgi:hypothetical protein